MVKKGELVYQIWDGGVEGWRGRKLGTKAIHPAVEHQLNQVFANSFMPLNIRYRSHERRAKAGYD